MEDNKIKISELPGATSLEGDAVVAGVNGGQTQKIPVNLLKGKDGVSPTVDVDVQDGTTTITITDKNGEKQSTINTMTTSQEDKLDGLADIKKVGANLTLEADGTLNAEEGTVDFNGLDNRPKYNGAAMTGSTDIPDLSGQVSENTSKIATNAQEIAAVDALIKSTQGNLTTEVTNRENADKAIQSQIDALVSKTDVVDIVGTYEQLQAYDTSALGNRDVIEVLSDVNHNNALSYYRWNDPTEGEWNWIGSISPYYTKSEADTFFVPATRTINGQSLAENIIIELPTKTSQLTNDSDFITSSALTNLVPNTRTVNGKALSENILLKTSDLENDSNYVNQTELATKQNKLKGSLAIQEHFTLTSTPQATSTTMIFTSAGYKLLTFRLSLSKLPVNQTNTIILTLKKENGNLFNTFSLNIPPISSTTSVQTISVPLYIASSNLNIPLILFLSSDSENIQLAENGITLVYFD